MDCRWAALNQGPSCKKSFVGSPLRIYVSSTKVFPEMFDYCSCVFVCWRVVSHHAYVNFSSLLSMSLFEFLINFNPGSAFHWQRLPFSSLRVLSSRRSYRVRCGRCAVCIRCRLPLAHLERRSSNLKLVAEAHNLLLPLRRHENAGLCAPFEVAASLHLSNLYACTQASTSLIL